MESTGYESKSGSSASTLEDSQTPLRSAIRDPKCDSGIYRVHEVVVRPGSATWNGKLPVERLAMCFCSVCFVHDRLFLLVTWLSNECEWCCLFAPLFYFLSHSLPTTLVGLVSCVIGHVSCARSV